MCMEVLLLGSDGHVEDVIGAVHGAVVFHRVHVAL